MAKNIKVLGTGCMKCEKLYEMTKKAVEEMGINANVEKITDLNKIMEFGVALTPALVVDNEVKIAGKVPHSIDEIKKYLGD